MKNMHQNNYRIRTNISSDLVVRASLTQDVDFLEILSLKIDQSNSYKIHTSNYGVIVGRVLANDAFGIPNAKVSVFVPLTDDDTLRSEIVNVYPYLSITDKDKDNRRYNLLKDESKDDCYRVVGTFPNKRLVLDNNTEIEVFDKYWVYTTVTNQSGDYMIFGVPTGKQQVHVDVDLSDIGVLSQKPRDFMYKGYNATQFDNPNQFKESTNLDDLSQILTQTSSVHVYPFWGDSNAEEIAITRCDLQVQYKFEPTCVFFGSIISDSSNNAIGDKCNPSKFVGFNRDLVAGEGTIEMIRKTPDGLIEEFQIQGNRLIDGNGVWCYQIPMNLDFVGTDEYGNIVPTDNPKKGIPTKTSVRFRISMQETSNDGIARHRAKYLVPNVHKVIDDASSVRISNPNDYEQCYEFGSATPNEFFRDLYWNKVYSVKNYIPRIQTSASRNTQKYCALRTANSSGSVNPLPFNRARFKLYFSYKLLCLLFEIVSNIICALNFVIKTLACSFCIPLGFTKICPLGWLCSVGVSCISVSAGISEDEDTNVEYFPCCNGCHKCCKCKAKGCVKDTSKGNLLDKVQVALAQEYDTVNLDFYNDWLNGCLYMPLWFWKKTKKKRYLFGLFSKKAVNRFCDCDTIYKKLKVTENCSLNYDTKYNVTNDDGGKEYHYKYPSNPPIVGHGIIKEFENNDNLKVYYYSPGTPTIQDYKNTKSSDSPYVRLYSTDIILLGSLNDCDVDNLPRPFLNLPSTTANVPYISTIRDDSSAQTESDAEKGVVEITGMDWIGNINNGLFMGLSCSHVVTKPKSCINVSRLSELGVSLDARYFDSTSTGSDIIYRNERPADGMITRYEIMDHETRAMFASLNHNGLTEKIPNIYTGYDTYKLMYMYPTDFDGHLSRFAPAYTRKNIVKTFDNKDESYVDFKLGLTNKRSRAHYYSSTQFPLFNNSFYFYFGLKEGNTAIDKFNKLFHSTCFKNKKYPFKLTYSTYPAQWCKDLQGNTVTMDGNYIALSDLDLPIIKQKLPKSYASISVNVNGIKLPYSYELYDEYNALLMAEENLIDDTIKFGYQIDSNGGQFVTDDNNQLVKFGALTYFNTGEIVTFKHLFEGSDKEIDAAYLLNNGTYNLKVIDASGASIIQPIVISQSPINMDITTIALGAKYYPGNTVHDDLCNEYRYNGEIIINHINIDGVKYMITAIKEKSIAGLPHSTFDIDLLEITNSINKDIQHAELDIAIQQYSTNDNNDDVHLSFGECACHNKKGTLPKRYELDHGVLKFNIWVPGNYELTITQICNGKLNNNTSSELANVSNGAPFNAFLNDVPIKFILGNYTNKYPHYNKMFYPKANSGTNLHPHSEMSEDLTGWFNLHKETTYCFPSLKNENDSKVWADFIDVEIFSPLEDKPKDYALTIDSQANIISYKMMCMMNMCMNYYMSDSSPKMANLTHTGGKAPILYRCMTPSYEDMGTQINRFKPINTVTYNSDGIVSAIQNAPNIVGGNYTQYRASSGVYTNDVFNCDPKLEIYENYNDKYGTCPNCGDKSDRFHPHFNFLLGKNIADARKQGNYFAVFTSNGGMKKTFNDETLVEEWVYDPAIKYIQIPRGTASNIPGVNPGETVTLGTGYSPLLTNTITEDVGQQTTPYLRTMFVDLRLDYDLIVFMPFHNTSLTNIKTNRGYGNLWKNGRIVGYIHNPLELAYDSDMNIVGASSDPKSNEIYEYTIPQLYADNEHIVKFSDCGPSHDYNEFLKIEYNRLSNKKLFDGYIRSDGWSLDIKDKLLSDIRPRITPISKNMDDPNEILYFTPDLSVFNASLSDKDYPLRRWVDIANIPDGNQIRFSATSCKYNNDLVIQTIPSLEGSNKVPLDYSLTIDGGDDVGFDLSTNNAIKFYESMSAEEAARRQNANLHFYYDSANHKFTVSYDMIFKFKLPSESSSDSHNSFSYTPFIFNAYYKDANNISINTLEQLMCVQDGYNFDRKAKSLNDVYKSYRQILDSTGHQITDKPHMIFDETVSEVPAYMYGGFNGDLLDTTDSLYWVDATNKSNILYDTNAFPMGIQYIINGATMRDYIFNKLNNCLILGVGYIRQFVSLSNDNLTKSITTFNIGATIDLRSVDMSCIDAHIETIQDQDDLGNISSKQVQTTKFRIITHTKGQDYDMFNSSFTNMQDAALSYTGSLRSFNKITTNVQFNFETVDVVYDGIAVKENCMIIDVVWDGELSGAFLPDKYVQTYLFIKAPDSNITVFKFGINKTGDLSRP